MLWDQSALLADLATKGHIPTMLAWREHVEVAAHGLTIPPALLLRADQVIESSSGAENTPDGLSRTASVDAVPVSM